MKLGKREARIDHRIPRMSAVLFGVTLPALPLVVNNNVGNWGMLGNDTVGDCVEAAVLHCIEQFSAYAISQGSIPLIASTTEAIKFYSDATGYNPSNPNTDQGSYVLGQGGVMDYWMQTGVTCGGTLNKVQAYLQIAKKTPLEWQQGIYLFGGMLTGIQLPMGIMTASGGPPAVWSDSSGPIDGGHEIWINGYDQTTKLYQLVSWGQTYEATEDFLQAVVDETCVVVDPIEINSRGVNVNNFSIDQLVSYMTSLKMRTDYG